MVRPETKKCGRPRLDLKVKTSICTSPLYRKKWWLEQKYMVEKLSAREISVLVGHSHHAVNQALKRFGLLREPSQTGRLGLEVRSEPKCRIVPARTKALIKWMIRLRGKGISYREIAHRLETKGIKSPSGNSKWYACTVRLAIKRNTPAD